MRTIEQPIEGETPSGFHMRVAKDVVDNFNELFGRIEAAVELLEKRVELEGNTNHANTSR